GGAPDDEVIDLYQRHNQPLGGEPDTAVHHSAPLSLRFTPREGAALSFTVQRLHQVPNLAHRLSVWVRADKPTPLTLTLTPVRPGGAKSGLVMALAARDPAAKPFIPHWDDPCEPLKVNATADTAWREITLDVRRPTAPVDYYQLTVGPVQQTGGTWWIDTIRMQPVWPE
ncbi:MAG: hypothetical protein GX590_03605, partial [Lentisphaerae bacterium]|nr:hypothetical protein [Lentisphaerota bacterium]